jgi:Skp family chaperone for outer membrane proteins
MRQDQAQQAFLDEVGPVLDQILTEMGAELIIDRASVILASPSIDITDLAIRRIDETLLPTGTVAEPDAGPAPAGSGQD